MDTFTGKDIIKFCMDLTYKYGLLDGYKQHYLEMMGEKLDGFITFNPPRINLSIRCGFSGQMFFCVSTQKNIFSEIGIPALSEIEIRVKSPKDKRQALVLIKDMYEKTFHILSSFFPDVELKNDIAICSHNNHRSFDMLGGDLDVCKIVNGKYVCYDCKDKVTKKLYVYLIQADRFYKIGVSSNVERRLKELGTLPPFNMQIIHTFIPDNAFELEARLHAKFKDKRTSGEWFLLNGSDVEYIKGL